jgi:hypothetical protein
MLSLEFARVLFRLNDQTPAFDELFQLPPEIGAILRRFPCTTLFRLTHGNQPAADHAP